MDAPRDPEELEATGAPVRTELPAATRMGAVHLGVADLDRSIGYYGSALGLQVHRRENGQAALGTGGEDLLVLNERPGAQPARGVTGLYHFALLVPERADLAAFLAHVARNRIPLTGLSDHFVSEAIYLRDPDEHGIEVYWDRPREVWEGRVGETLTTEPLDVDSLLGVLDDPEHAPFDALAAGTVMGHVHLRVADTDEATRFYRDGLGFALMAQLGQSAAFLAAGGYHHHLGANSWESAGAEPAGEGVATLERVTILVPGLEQERTLRDPSGNPLALVPA